MENLRLYTHRRIGDAAWLVTETVSPACRVNIGVIAGLEKIAVINAGFGLGGDLRKYIESFAGTDKPFVLYCTGGAKKHVGGAAPFPEAYVSPLDAELGDALPEVPAEIAAFSAARRPADEASFRPLRPGFIAIGRQHIMPRPFPGNTPGAFIISNNEQKLCFLGDAVGAEVTSLPCLDRAGFAQYAENLRKLPEGRGADLTFYVSDSSRPLPKEYILAVADACREIAEGKTAGDLIQEGTRKIHLTENAAVLYDAARL